jgi:LPXTG-motif cell wall-anchored protein
MEMNLGIWLGIAGLVILIILLIFVIQRNRKK